jgi:hypothetical protein
MLFSPRGRVEKVGGGAGTHAPASVPPACQPKINHELLYLSPEFFGAFKSEVLAYDSIRTNREMYEFCLAYMAC